MIFNKAEARDFKCRSCGTTWSKYIENKKRCRNSVLKDGRHNFDFGKPIRVDSQEREASMTDDKVHDGKIIFQ